MNKEKNQHLRRILVLVGLVFMFSFTLAITEEECEFGGGTLTISQIISPEEPLKGDLKPYCSCLTGFFWNLSSMTCENDTELRCLQTGGNWTAGNCSCPEGTIGWVEGFGCDQEGPVPNIENQQKEEGKYYSFLGFLLVIALLVGIIYKYLRRNK